MNQADELDPEVERYLAGVPEPTWSDPNLRQGPNGGVGVLQGLVDAMRLLPAVGKDNEHKGDRTGTWTYRSADAVVSAVGPALAKAGVVLLPVLNDDQPITLGDSDGWRLDMTYRFFGVDGSSLSFRMISHSVGRTAYTIGAGYSYALKYALSQALCLPFDDPRMDMESHSSHGAGVHWWQDGGWESVEAHDTRRAFLLDTIKGLPADERATVVSALHQIREHPVYNPGGYKVAGGSVWTPTDLGNPTGPGRLVSRLSVAAMIAAEQAAGIEHDPGPEDEPGDEPDDGGPDVEPDSPRGDVEPEAPAEPSSEPAKPEPVASGPRKAQERPRRGKATDTAAQAPEAQEGAPGAPDEVPAEDGLTDEQIKANRASLSRSLLALAGPDGAAAEAALTDAGLWPISDLKTRGQFDRAANALIPILKAAGKLP